VRTVGTARAAPYRPRHQPGVAIVDGAYAALGVAGVTQLLRLPQLRLALGLAGAVVLLTIGARTLWSAFRIRSALSGAGVLGFGGLLGWRALRHA
jgi:arginine exporter protein ArgO